MNKITVNEASILLKCSEQYVRRKIKEKKISAELFGKSWMIEESSVYDYILTSSHKYIPDKKNSFNYTPDIKCLSFFSGAMGLDLGFEREGICSLLVSEINSACKKTILLNRPEIGLIGDVNNYTLKQIKYMAGLSEFDEIDVVIGGPPCQSFSTAGQRAGFNDDRGNLFVKFIDIILGLRPKFAVIENVRGLLSASLDQFDSCNCRKTFRTTKGSALMYAIKLLRAGGYTATFNLYNSALFGSPQTRERVVILCSRDGSKVPYLTQTHSELNDSNFLPIRTLSDVIKDLPEDEHDFIDFPEKRLKYYRLLRAGQNWRNLPTELQKEALGKSYFLGGGKTGFLRRLHWDKPSPTLVTHPAMPATDLAHPEKDRPLSIQEYKRIQEFPDNWRLGGSILEQYKQIGNAVPVSMGAAIARKIKECILGNYSKNTNVSFSRYKNTDEIAWEREFKAKIEKQCASNQLTFNIK